MKRLYFLTALVLAAACGGPKGSQTTDSTKVITTTPVQDTATVTVTTTVDTTGKTNHAGAPDTNKASAKKVVHTTKK